MSATVHWWIGETPEPGVLKMIERVSHFDDVAHIAVMPDVHVANDVCVGTAMATHRLLYPAAVGGDIGCGMLAVAFDVQADCLNDGATAGKVLRGLSQSIPASRRHRRFTLEMPESLREPMSHPALDAIARSEGVLQLGTVGGSNHFVELQRDPDDRLWLMVHTGSRAIGQAVRAHHVARSSTHPIATLDADTDIGRAYLHDAAWASAYAQANRRAIAQCVESVLGDVLNARADASSCIECDHNHVRRELHDGRWLYVHRKGAMPADEGLAGVVPGSMGTLSYHVAGKGNARSLRSSAHGAGRRLSRARARERFANADIKHQMRNVWYDPRHTAALREESPGAYKDVREVMKAQAELVDVVRTLRPVLVYKGA